MTGFDLDLKILRMNEAIQEEVDVSPDSDSDIIIDDNEVEEVIESIQESEYFDSSSMSPLTPASVVSIPCKVPISRRIILKQTRQLYPD